MSKFRGLLFLVSLVPLLFSACGDEKKKTAAEFDGTYYSGVAYNGSYSSIDTISGTSEKMTWVNVDANGAALSKWESTYTTVAEGDYLDGQKICKTLTKRVITVYTDSEVATYNTYTACGFSDWQKGVAKDVGIKGWDGTDENPKYNIRILINNRLCFGKTTSTYDASTEAKRPVDFEFANSAAGYTWVKSLGNTADFNGTYHNGVQYDGSYAGTFTISGTTETSKFYDVNASGVAQSIWEDTYTVTVEGDYFDGQKVCKTLTKRTVTVLTDDMLSIYNSYNGCGFSNWEKGVAKDVGIKGWDGTDEAPIYDIRLLISNRLYYGKTSGTTYDRSSAAKRPIEFDLASTSPRVKSLGNTADFNGTYHNGVPYDGSYAGTFNISDTTETSKWYDVDASGVAKTCFEDTYTITVEGDYLDGQKICKTLTKRIITILSDDMITTFNTYNGFGFSNWEKGVAKDVGIKGWSGSDETPRYDIRLLLNNRIYFGKTSADYDCSSAEKRPIEFDLSAASPRVKF